MGERMQGEIQGGDCREKGCKEGAVASLSPQSAPCISFPTVPSLHLFPHSPLLASLSP